MKLQGKVALVTGASRGIGKATALLLAKEGARVIINYKTNEAAALAVAKEIGPKQSLFMQADVTKESEVKTMMQQIKKQYGTLDILVNNAGEIIQPGSWQSDVTTWQKTLDVNLTSAWLVTREAVPLMKQEGSIVNITSTVGLLGSQYVLAYSCAKNGLVALTKSFAKELAPGIRVNAVAPSNVMTDMTLAAGDELIERMKAATPLLRIAEPKELATAIVFLASDDASYITGQVLVVDGGYSLK